MCHDTIISPDMIRARARHGHAQGKRRTEHGMNPGAAAIADWQDEWDQCQLRSRRRVKHITDAGNKVDQQLGAA